MDKTNFNCQQCGEPVIAKNDLAYKLMLSGHSVICKKCLTGELDYAGMPYELYLKTDRWKDKATACKAAAANRCQVCNAGPPLHAHHRTYDRRGYELPSDLTALCPSCHDLVTFHGEKPNRSNGDIREFLGSGLFRGVGPVMANRIVDMFGDHTMQIINDDPGQLEKVIGLRPLRIAAIINRWDELKGRENIIKVDNNG